jgi:hypothetical protein
MSQSLITAAGRGGPSQDAVACNNSAVLVPRFHIHVFGTDAKTELLTLSQLRRLPGRAVALHHCDKGSFTDHPCRMDRLSSGG